MQNLLCLIKRASLQTKKLIDCSQPVYLRTPKKKRAKLARRTPGWAVGYASEARRKNRETADIHTVFGLFGKKKWTY